MANINISEFYVHVSPTMDIFTCIYQEIKPIKGEYLEIVLSSDVLPLLPFPFNLFFLFRPFDLGKFILCDKVITLKDRHGFVTG